MKADIPYLNNKDVEKYGDDENQLDMLDKKNLKNQAGK